MLDFIKIPSNPIPENASLIPMTMADGSVLRTALFRKSDAKGTVVLLNGRSEFIEKYFEVIEELRARGFSVATMDWRGQGLSSRLLPVSEKGHINSFETYKSDLRRFFEDVVKPNLPGPYILMTHSMGGMPALLLLADGYDGFERAVLCAPMTSFRAPALTKIIGRIASAVAVRLGGSRGSVAGVKEHSLEFEGNVLTSDPVRHARFRELQEAAPNACIFAPTYGWLHAAIKAVDAIHKPGALSAINVPVLIISAETDLLVDSEDQRQLAEAYDKITRVLIKGALHEIMMEKDEYRSAFWESVDGFIADAPKS